MNSSPFQGDALLYDLQGAVLPAHGAGVLVGRAARSPRMRLAVLGNQGQLVLFLPIHVPPGPCPWRRRGPGVRGSLSRSPMCTARRQTLTPSPSSIVGQGQVLGRGDVADEVGAEAGPTGPRRWPPPRGRSRPPGRWPAGPACSRAHRPDMRFCRMMLASISSRGTCPGPSTIIWQPSLRPISASSQLITSSWIMARSELSARAPALKPLPRLKTTSYFLRMSGGDRTACRGGFP